MHYGEGHRYWPVRASEKYVLSCCLPALMLRSGLEYIYVEAAMDNEGGNESEA